MRNEQQHLAGEGPQQGVRHAAGDPAEAPAGVQERGAGVEADEHSRDHATRGLAAPAAAPRIGIDGKCLLPPRAGVARYLEGLLQGLSELRESGIVAEVVRPKRPGHTLPWVLWDLQRATGKGFAAFHFPFYYPPLFPRCPFTVAIHDVLILQHPEWFPRAWTGPIRWLLPRGARRAAGVIASGVANAEAIATLCRVPRERVHVIPYGVDPVRFAPRSRAEVKAAEARLGIRPPYLLQVGAHEPRRGVDLAIAATAALRGEGRDIELVLAGQERAPVTALAAPPGWVRQIGRVDDSELPSLYAGAAAVLAPSLGEGFDLPVLEALACGGAVIASDIAAHVEQFAGAVELFASGDATALTAACRRVLGAGDRAAALRAAGPRLAARFTWRECARRHVEVWRRVTGR